METGVKTVSERVAQNVVALYGYKKYSDPNEKPNEKSTQKTGNAFDISRVENLAIVDVDVKKDLTDEEKQTIRDSIIEKLPRNVGMVVT